MARTFTLILLMLFPWHAAAGEWTNEEPPLPSFVLGDYVIVGKAPDNGATYSGRARIEKKGDKLVLLRLIGEKRIVSEGVVETPSPPGEGKVLRFRWNEGEAREMSCLASSDLDNYPRLTCYWVVPQHRHREPGIEAMFPTAAWPEDAPNKSFNGAP